MARPAVVVLTPRQSDILREARDNGRVTVDGLSTLFDVTPQTIRRDLNDLCESGHLQRVHGGAVVPAAAQSIAYDTRRDLASEAKRKIARHTAALIPNKRSLILNIGTTTEQVAMALRYHTDLMVVTNNINVARILQSAETSQVIVAGGVVRASDGGIVGEATVEFIRQFKVDTAIIGASAIDEDGWIMDYDFREVRVAQEIIRQARQTILVADRTKFDHVAPIRIAHLSEIDVFVTDRPPPPSIPSLCEDHGIDLQIVASTADATARTEQ